MRKNHEPQGPVNQEFPASERLDSWKEIAAYLKRDVRTVRRWESSEGLPARRHMHGRQASIYAYKPEIDAWWNNRRPRLEAQEQVQQRSGRWWAAAAVVVLAVASAGLWWAGRPALPFEERDWVLIASFENRTGEPLFDGTLEHALERELSNSRFVNVVPRWRVADTLSLMRKPQEGLLNAALAREVALRDGGVRVVLAGRVEKLGTQLLMSVRVINPLNGVTVATLSEEAAQEAEVGGAVYRLANRVRDFLGERLPRLARKQQPLERVTTPSLRALRLFSEGSLLKEQFRVKEAEPLFREAIKEDPEFATAYMWLAWTVMRLGQPAEEYLPLAGRALELSDKAREHERLFNQASYSIFTEKYEDAYSTMSALLQLYPDNYWATASMTWLPARVNRPEETLRHVLKLADLRPNDFGANHRAARALLTEEGQTERMRRYLERALALAAKEESGDRAAAARRAVAELKLLVPLHDWKRGDIARAHREVERLAEDLGSYGDPRGDGRAELMLGAFYLGFGEWRRAEQVFGTIPKSMWRNYALSWLAMERNDATAYLDYRRAARPGTWGSVQLIYFGHLREARWEIADLEKAENVWQPYLDASRAMLRLREGDSSAIPALQDAIEAAWRGNATVSFTASRLLSEFYEQHGDLGNAIRTLEAASEEGLATLDSPYALSHWLWVRASLAQLYRKAGRPNEAEALEQDLRKRLIYADPAHPILRTIAGTADVTLSQVP